MVITLKAPVRYFIALIRCHVGRADWYLWYFHASVLEMKFKRMSIPTSILIDENGKILWIDQSEGYRLRAS